MTTAQGVMEVQSFQPGKGMTVKHYYSTVDDVVLTFSDVHADGLSDYIRVYFERPNDTGFDFAEGTIPSCVFTKTYGFSQDELMSLRRYLKDNELLIWQLATGYFDRAGAQTEVCHA